MLPLRKPWLHLSEPNVKDLWTDIYYKYTEPPFMRVGNATRCVFIFFLSTGLDIDLYFFTRFIIIRSLGDALDMHLNLLERRRFPGLRVHLLFDYDLDDPAPAMHPLGDMMIAR